MLAIGGGAGVAADDGTVYFLSPEALDPGTGSQPIAGAPNLYLARPGEQPRFVGTLESSATGQIPLGAHPFRRYLGALQNPQGVAIDNATGDVYVLDRGAQTEFQKFNSNGQLQTDYGSGGKVPAPSRSPESPSTMRPAAPMKALCISRSPENSRSTSTNVLGPSSKKSPSSFRRRWRSIPSPATLRRERLRDRSDLQTRRNPGRRTLDDLFPTSLAVDSTGKVYVSNSFEGSDAPVHAFSSSGTDREVDPGPARSVSVDPADHHLYIDRGGKIDEFDASGNPVNAPMADGKFGDSYGVAAASGNVAVTNRSAGTWPSSGRPSRRRTRPSTTRWSSTASTRATSGSGRLPAQPGRRRCGPHVDPVADRIRQRLPPSGLQVPRRNRRARLRLLQSHGQRSTGEASLPARGLGVTDEAVSSSTRPKAGGQGPQRPA